MKPTSDITARIKPFLKTLTQVAGLAAAVVFLNALMNAGFTSAENHISRLLLISPEIFVITILLGLMALFNFSYHRAVFPALTLVIIFLLLFNLADSLVPAYFFRPFNMYLDSQMLPDLVFLLYSTVPLKTFVLGSFLTLLSFGFIILCISRALRAIHAFFINRSRRGILAATVFLLGILIYSPQPWLNGQAAFVFAPGKLHRVAAEFDFILHLSDITRKHNADLEKAVQRGRDFPRPLAKLNGSDVFIFFIESYGHIVFNDWRHAPLIIPHLKDTEDRLTELGYLACSNYLKSPAYGGSSWLAHGALASGVNISSELVYYLLLTSQVQPVAEYFNRAGYRTVSVMPGTLWPWPAGEYYRYRKKYYAPDFDYKGPKFGWAPMTDQYVLDAIYRNEILNRTTPLFIEFVLISSHAPFNEMPRYLHDWSTIGDGSIYHDHEPIRFPVTWPALENASEAYIASIKYDWQVLMGFMEKTASNKQIIIILGDHQPNLKITGENQPWSVPVHIISRSPDLIRPFINKGCTPGLVPAQPLPHAGIESLLWLLLEEFS